MMIFKSELDLDFSLTAIISGDDYFWGYLGTSGEVDPVDSAGNRRAICSWKKI